MKVVPKPWGPKTGRFVVVPKPLSWTGEVARCGVEKGRNARRAWVVWEGGSVVVVVLDSRT